MLKVVQCFVYLALNNLFMVYGDSKNGLGMTVHAVRLASVFASPSANAQHCQNADAKGCTVI